MDQLILASAHSLVGRPFTALAVDGAVDALVAGLDGDALRELAGLSRSSREEDVRALLAPVLSELGLSEPSLADAQIIVLRDMGSAVLAGDLPLRAMTSWAHDVVGHDGPDPAQEIAELDDELDIGLLTDHRGRIMSFLAATSHLRGARAPGTPVSDDARHTGPRVSALIERAEGLARDGKLRDAGRLLRDELATDPRDVGLREALTELYRAAGHPDQAGRYALALADPMTSELDAYRRLLVATGADEAQVRRLSLVPDEWEVPESFLDALASERRARTVAEPWDTLAAWGIGGFFVIALLTVLTVYFVAVFGGSFATEVARTGGVVSAGILSVGLIGLTVAGAVERSRSAFGWGALALLLLVATAFGVAGLLVA